jgi:hypothetical protein
MSNTTRKVDHGWAPGTEAFDKWNATRPEKKQIKSVKHQTRDRQPKGRQGGKDGRFIKGVRNSRWNLLRKNENLATKENFDAAM